MTKKFDKAMKETIQKCNRVLEAVRLAIEVEESSCSFCETYYGCDECPVDKLCGGELHVRVEELLKELEEKVLEGISLLEKLEEKFPS